MKLAFRLVTVAIQMLLLVSSVSAAAIEKRGAGGKAGIAWPGRLDTGLSKAFSTSGHTLSWHWHWSPLPPSPAAGSKAPPGEFVSMMYGPSSISDGVPRGSVVMGFNEPDGCQAGTQSCMSMGDVVDKHRVGSPAPAGNTVAWLKAFFAACDARGDCVKPSFITMHAYVSTVDALKNYVTEVHEAFPNMPIWLTEFACHSFGGQPQPTNQQQVHDFMGGVTAWLDSVSFVERYSWFGAGQGQDMFGVNGFNRLQYDNGALTPLGNQYVFKRHA
ncbi:hypothetical protein QFC21_006902 [Naganishia friedmannii]|uniref:Uncharacterized protein n=1 Tax=Naganishia friedmannii TaxID=89922 RepID=A0ACC2UYU7_9TREE|nr:hypothetical protein QFC21_006902 [Naganishia friedmannii]